jgi:hypothetical protein
MGKNALCALIFFSLYFSNVQAQTAIPATGSNAQGIGGSVSYTIGQVNFSAISGVGGTVLQGVQQPYEISVVTASKKSDAIILECIVYPNPAKDYIRLIVKMSEYKDLQYQLYNLNGVNIQERKIESESTEISLDGLPSSTYFMKILTRNKMIKTFKIIKN